MSSIRSVLACLAALIATGAATGHAQGIRDNGLANRFAWKLYEGISTESTGNLVVSPFSVSSALAMTYAGAGDSTAAEMARTLGFDPDPTKVAQTFEALNYLLTSDAAKGGADLRVANSLWGSSKAHFHEPFLAMLEKTFGAPLHQVSFDDPEATSRAINAWVEDQTQGRIADLISPKAIDRLTELVLVDALYFRSRWQSPFWRSSTTDRPFAVSGGDSVSVPTMHQESTLDYYEDDLCQIVGLHYTDEFSLMVVLPRSTLQPAGIDSALMSAIREWPRRNEERNVSLFLPRFTLRNRYHLNDRLAAMGMPIAFTMGEADFSGMSDDSLYISNVTHEAWLNLDEKGTEATAATSVKMSTWSAVKPVRPKPPVVFRADHPFLFMIYHVPTQTLLFLGRVTDPSRSS